MNLKRLETFIRVADHHHFSEAAERLKLTQSAVSRQIKTLEEELGLQLFNRNTAFVELTSAGRVVYKKARELLGHWEQFQRECRQLQEGLSGLLRIGASTIPALYMLPSVAQAFRNKYPQVELSISMDDSASILQQLVERRIDVALIGDSPQGSGLVSKVIAEDRLALIGSDPERKVSTLEEVVHDPFIMREKGSGTREAADRALRSHGLDPEQLRTVAEVNTTESVLALVEAGMGLSLVSCWAVGNRPRQHVHILMELATDRCFSTVALASRQHDALVQSFIAETVNTIGGSQP
ncbi:selenium metabolism-associated LysR family transcriptional regulator [Xylanibacillus composti]|uniref:LysR family transcriptional regulator n=1 Tax=Xylanibacillus composti TaxID=1572762 RepID=A0A8J4M2P3_9BACL|nr:selenium metabolism-associated LysR family transcriptional regulator [Xylanibacillus composti]GIQ69142.1 LysR family transcriptional regulator [Xylanibacillus composti]